MRYYIKVIAEEGEILRGDVIAWWVESTHGELVKARSNSGYPKIYKKAKYVLCDGDGKIIGEISNDALTFVSEGDEIREEDIYKRVLEISQDGPRFGADWIEGREKLGYKCGVQIKGPCGHFH